MIGINDIKEKREVRTLVEWANKCMEAMGYTDHGPRHVGYVSKVTSDVLKALGYNARIVELGAIAGWVHDVGNSINRKNHGLTGSNLLFPILLNMGMDINEICMITSAVGNHEEEHGYPVSEISAALIIADKSDAHRTRVRVGKYNPEDIHDRVNYAIKKSRVVVDNVDKVITYEMEIGPTSSVMEFLQIYMSRMTMSERAAKVLGCSFQLVANGLKINNPIFTEEVNNEVELKEVTA